ncbi:alkaline phosphatase [Sphingobacterium sp. SYP-B4668]|uniref:alkaline phosphatase n=1 Tax=Sphingobacterium sp. SYP-B4668 TaxID=2996035 RepID=UPI0022DD4E9E|nr:alkaline phosphatase [Sphingobacterium sp. SYP-B4668]
MTFVKLFLALVLTGAASNLLAQPAQVPEGRFDRLMYGAHNHRHSIAVRGHSHNDYEQDIPLLRAYYAGMESIEADLFLRDDSLYVAHDAKDIMQGRTLDQLYIKPLANLFTRHGQQPFADSTKNLQLVLDFKEDHRILLPKLIALLEPYRFMFDPALNKHAIRIVISGDMPQPSSFQNYPDYIFFDGRFELEYSDVQLQRIAMMSDNLRNYTKWNGKGVPTREEMAHIEQQAARARLWHKPFRLWGAPESPNTWIILEKMGITWLNTDHPDVLKTYLDDLDAARVEGKSINDVYLPTYIPDGSNRIPKNVILLIGDGMGLGHIQATMVANKGHLNMTQLKYIGFSQTTSLSPGNTDSGAGGSAIATGQKSYNGTISVDTIGNRLPRLPEVLAKVGKVSAVLSTGDASDATPAAFYASHTDRNASIAITEELLDNDVVKIIAGELPTPYRDSIRRHALEHKLNQANYQVVSNVQQFQRSTSDKLIGYFSEQDMTAIKDGRKDILRSLLTSSIDKMDSVGAGFFIMAEGAQIDYGGHARDLDYVVTETLDFDQAVGAALRFADKNGETLVIVTADHETGALSLLHADIEKGKLQAHFASNDHSAMMIPVMAYGPRAQYFTGYYQNTELFNKIVAVLEASD